MIRVGLAGLGYWGPNLARNFNSLPNAELVALCDKLPTNLEQARGQYPQARIYQDYDEFLTHDGMDAVVVALPAGMHFEATKKALLAGRHVLVEKPMARTSKEGQELIALAKDGGLVLMVGHTFLFNAAVRRLRQYVKSGELGDIYYIYAQRLNLGRVRDDVDVFWNFAPHDFSIGLFLTGSRPVGVTARGFSFLQPDIPDVGFGVVEFESGTILHIHVSWLDPTKTRRMTVVGSKKMIVYDDTSLDQKIQVYDKGITKEDTTVALGEFDSFAGFQLIQRAGDLLVPRIDFQEPLKQECSHFCECIEQNRPPLTDGQHGLEVVRLLEAAQTSLKNGGKRVAL